ncbi:MAG: hypothetical protein JWL76_1452 [Thermoleophilia bacterium]|nr:hypothetical protein [Thermoleophilia bacterium]
MESSLVALKLVVRSLEEATEAVETGKADVQSLVYLVQQCGVDLGYSYGWYEMGPFSPALARSCVRLADQDAAAVAPDKRLSAPALRCIDRVRGLVSSRTEAQGSGWVSALAAMHFLQNQVGKSEPEAMQVITTARPEWTSIAGAARQALVENDLIAV